MSEPLWFSFPPFRLDVVNGQLYDGEQPVAMRPKTLAVLTLLAGRAGEVVSRDELLGQLWPESAVQDATLTASIVELRRALRDSRADTRFIETLHGRGFRFVAEVEVSRGLPILAPASGSDPLVFERRPFSFLFPPFRLDLGKAQLYRGDQAIELRPKTLAVLEFLARRAGDVVSKAEILHVVWRDVTVQEKTLTASIVELRRALDDDSDHPSFIETVHGRGLRFLVDVHVSMHPTPPDDGRQPSANAFAEGVPFIGRGMVMAKLEQAFDQVFDGSGAMVVVLGPAGIGKSRLLEEVCRFATRRGAYVLPARAEDGLQQAPFRMWAEIVRGLATSSTVAELRQILGIAAADIAVVVPSLREVLGDLGGSLPGEPDIARARFLDGMLSFLGRAALLKPLVLVFDDVHSAGVSSLALLKLATRLLESHRLLLIVSYREGEEHRNQALSSLLSEWDRNRRVSRIALAGLTPEDARALVGATSEVELAPGLAERIASDTSGNPYFVLEILAALRQTGEPRVEHYDIPETVHRLLEERVSRTSETARRLLTAGAVAGSEFDIKVAARTAGLDWDVALRAGAELDAHGLAGSGAGRMRWLRFNHALLRETLLSSLSPLERARLHLRTGEAIEEIHGASDTNLSSLAFHFSEAAEIGGAARAANYGLRAGQQAAARYSHEEARDLLWRANQLADSEPAVSIGQRCEILAGLSEALTWTGELIESEAAADRLFNLAIDVDSPAWLARAAIQKGRHYMPFRPRTDARPVDLLEQALAALGSEPTALRAEVMVRLAMALHAVPEAQQRRAQLAESAMAIARQSTTGLQRLLIARGAVTALWDPDHLPQRLALAEELVDTALAYGEPFEIGYAYLWKALDLIAVGQLRAADVAVDRVEELLSRTPTGSLVRHALRFRIILAVVRGQLGRAREQVLRFSQTPGYADNSLAPLEMMLADISIKRELGELGEFVDMVRMGALQFPVFPLGLGLPYFLLAAGQVHAAQAQLTALAANDFNDLPPRNEPFCWLPAVASLADVCADVGDRGSAEKLYARLDRYAGRWIVVHFGGAIFGSVDRCLGRLAATMGEPERAATHFEATIAHCEVEGAIAELARSKLDYAVGLERFGADGQQRGALAKGEGPAHMG